MLSSHPNPQAELVLKEVFTMPLCNIATFFFFFQSNQGVENKALRPPGSQRVVCNLYALKTNGNRAVALVVTVCSRAESKSVSCERLGKSGHSDAGKVDVRLTYK